MSKNNKKTILIVSVIIILFFAVFYFGFKQKAIFGSDGTFNVEFSGQNWNGYSTTTNADFNNNNANLYLAANSNGVKYSGSSIHAQSQLNNVNELGIRFKVSQYSYGWVGITSTAAIMINDKNIYSRSIYADQRHNAFYNERTIVVGDYVVSKVTSSSNEDVEVFLILKKSNADIDIYQKQCATCATDYISTVKNIDLNGIIKFVASGGGIDTATPSRTGAYYVKLTVEPLMINNITECKIGEVKSTDGSCRKLIQTCIDANENNVCDMGEPVIWVDPLSNSPVCSDRDQNSICDNVQALFCEDIDNNKVCDEDETKWAETHCEDINSNGICDDVEENNIICPTLYQPICDIDNQVTYPNNCFANSQGITKYTVGACPIKERIVEKEIIVNDSTEKDKILKILMWAFVLIIIVVVGIVLYKKFWKK